MIHIKSTLSDDIFGLWHVKKISVKKDGRWFDVAHNDESFPTKDDAEQYGRMCAQRFLQRELCSG